MIALLVIGCVLAYCMIGTAIGVKAYWLIVDRDERSDAAFSAGSMAILWPVCVWFLIGMLIISRGTDRRERQAVMNAERERFLAQARKELGA